MMVLDLDCRNVLHTDTELELAEAVSSNKAQVRDRLFRITVEQLMSQIIRDAGGSTDERL